MKKIKLFSALALTLVMASCDNFDLPNPPGQTNTDPENYFASTDLQLAPVSGTLSLSDANAANQYVTVANITKFVNFPADYTLECEMEVGNDAQFSQVATIGTVIDGDAVTVNPDILNGAIQDVVTKRPGTYDVNSRIIAYAVKDNTRIRLGGENGVYLTEVVKVATLPGEKTIENSYYIVPFNGGNPDWSAAIKMDNTAYEGADGYDHPEFQVKIESPAGTGYTFKIAPESAMGVKDPALLIGGNTAADGFSGKLSPDYGAAHIDVAGDLLIVINVQADSYTVSYAFNVLYPYSGTLNANTVMKLYTQNYMTYTGVCAINNQWFVGASTDKKAEPLFKQSAEEEPVLSENGLTMTGLLTTASDASLIGTPEKGNHLYWVDVNLPQLTYSLTIIKTLRVVGSGNGWDEKNGVQLTASKDLKTWTATDVELGDMFKINANEAWDIDFGGVALPDATGEKVFEVSMKGGNLEVEPGKYDMELNFSAYPYILTLKKK